MDKFNHILFIAPDQTLAKKLNNWLGTVTSFVHIQDIDSAAKQAAIDKWGLVIIGIHTTNMHELDLMRIVKETNPTTPVLIIGENIKIDFVIKAMEYHADALLFKPLKKSEFISKVTQLMEAAESVREKKNGRVILAVGAHPDDVEFGCGGTLAKLYADGNQINILTLSLGAVGGDPLVRKKEAKKAAKIQNARLFLGDFEDTKITNANKTVKYIEKIVQKINPTHVYTHSIHDNHQDHRAVFKATITACRQVPNLFCYLSPSSTVDFRPNIFINVDNYIDTKLEIVSAFKSQMDLRPYLQPDLITATARYWGRFCNYHLAEPMEVIKEHS